MPITTIWVRIDAIHAKPIWRGELPHVLRAGDDIVIDPDLSIERVETATYDCSTGEVEARIAGTDERNAYPAIGDAV